MTAVCYVEDVRQAILLPFLDGHPHAHFRQSKHFFREAGNGHLFRRS